MDNQELQNLANMVSVRNHLNTLLNTGKSLARKDFQPVGHLISKLDAMLVKSSLELFKDEGTELVDDGLNLAEKIRKAKAELERQKQIPVVEAALSLQEASETLEPKTPRKKGAAVKVK